MSFVRNLFASWDDESENKQYSPINFGPEFLVEFGAVTSKHSWYFPSQNKLPNNSPAGIFPIESNTKNIENKD